MSTDAVNLAAMSREQLVTLNATLVARLNASKTELADARGRSSRGEAWMPPAEFNALRERVTRLTAEAQRVQSAIAVLNAKQAPVYEREFIAAARRFLTPETFRLIDGEARHAVDIAPTATA